jgi:hypothetical protein
MVRVCVRFTHYSRLRRRRSIVEVQRRYCGTVSSYRNLWGDLTIGSVRVIRLLSCGFELIHQISPFIFLNSLLPGVMTACVLLTNASPHLSMSRPTITVGNISTSIRT